MRKQIFKLRKVIELNLKLKRGGEQMSQNFAQNRTRNLMLYYSVAISVILALILLSLWLSPVYAVSNTNDVTIKEIKQTKAGVSQGLHVPIFELVSSATIFLPIPDETITPTG